MSNSTKNKKRTAKSPARRTAKSPARRTAKSPARRTAKSPARRTAKSPARRTAKSPARRNPKGFLCKFPIVDKTVPCKRKRDKRYNEYQGKIQKIYRDYQNEIDKPVPLSDDLFQEYLKKSKGLGIDISNDTVLSKSQKEDLWKQKQKNWMSVINKNKKYKKII